MPFPSVSIFGIVSQSAVVNSHKRIALDASGVNDNFPAFSARCKAGAAALRTDRS